MGSFQLVILFIVIDKVGDGGLLIKAFLIDGGFGEIWFDDV